MGDNNSGVEGQDSGRLEQTMGGHERMHGVDKMDPEGNSQEEKNLKFGMRRVLGGVNKGGKDHGFGWGMM